MLGKFLIILIGFRFTGSSLFDGLFSAQSIAKQDFDKQIVNSTKLNIAFKYPKDNTFETMDSTFKQQLAHSFGSVIDQLINDLIDVSQQSIEALLQFKNLLNQMLKNFKYLSKISEYEIEDDRIDKINELNERVFDKWNDFIKSYRKIEQNLETRNIRMSIEKNFYQSIDYKTVINFVNQFFDENHPLIEVLFEISEYKSQIINKLVEYNSENSENDIYLSNLIIKTIACELEMLLQHKALTDSDKIKQFIKTKVPENYQNKLILALVSGGIDALKTVLKYTCHSNPETMALIVMDLTNDLFPVKGFSDYQKQYRLFLFIQWIDSVVRDGLSIRSHNSIIKDSAEQLMESIKDFNEKTLTESLDEFKPFGERFRQILEVIEKELNEITNDFII